MRVPGQHENNSDRKEKISSKREDILDNTEPCQTKIRRASVVVDEQSWLSSGVEKSPFKRDYDHILKTRLTNYLQAYTLTGAACGTC